MIEYQIKKMHIPSHACLFLIKVGKFSEINIDVQISDPPQKTMDTDFHVNEKAIYIYIYHILAHLIHH